MLVLMLSGIQNYFYIRYDLGYFNNIIISIIIFSVMIYKEKHPQMKILLN